MKTEAHLLHPKPERRGDCEGQSSQIHDKLAQQPEIDID